MYEMRVWGLLTGLPDLLALGGTTRSQLIGLLGTSQYKPYDVNALADTAVFIYDLRDPEFTVLLECYLVADTLRVLRWRFRMG